MFKKYLILSSPVLSTNGNTKNVGASIASSEIESLLELCQKRT